MAKEKAIWDAKATAIFCKLCVIEKEKGKDLSSFRVPLVTKTLLRVFLEKQREIITNNNSKINGIV
jgi:hypothetical protein